MNSAESGDELRIRPLTVQDLELILAWRSNPAIYENFQEQDEPLSWEDHLNWFGSRPKRRHDFLIEYKGRRVGSVYVTEEDFVGVYVGETDLWGEGIGTRAMRLLVERCTHRTPLYAKVRENNPGSKRLFEKCGFESVEEDKGWRTYRYEK